MSLSSKAVGKAQVIWPKLKLQNIGIIRKEVPTLQIYYAEIGPLPHFLFLSRMNI